jgi:hypothetical protein
MLFSCPLALLLPHLLRERQFYLHKTVIEYLGKNLRGRERNAEKTSQDGPLRFL